MNISITDAEDRVWSLHRNYLQVLENSGLSGLLNSRPHICISLILKRLQPRVLQSRMEDIIEWLNTEQLDKTDFNLFMREVSIKAVYIEQEQFLTG